MANSLDQFQKRNDESINWREIFERFLIYWKWIAVSAIVFVILGYLYSRSQPTTFKLDASLLVVDQSRTGGMNEMSLLKQLDMGGVGNSNTMVNNENEVIKSVNLMKKVVSELELHTNYTSVKFLKKTNLYKSSPYRVELDSMSVATLQDDLVIEIVPNEDGSYKVVGKYLKKSFQEEVKSLPALLSTPAGALLIELKPGAIRPETKIIVTVWNINAVSRYFANAVLSTSIVKQNDVINLAVSVENIQMGKDILNTLIHFYNQDAIDQLNRSANNTKTFIDDRLVLLTDELKTVEKSVEDYKQINELTDVPTNIKISLERNNEFDNKRLEVETQLSLIRMVEDFVTHKRNSRALIPNLGLTDVGLLAVINQYNELLMTRERVSAGSSAENPNLIQLNRQIDATHAAIRTSIANSRKGLELTIRDLNAQNSGSIQQIRDLPRKEREFVEIKRQQQVKESLYLFLLQKREETALTQAAVAPKAKIVSEPYSNDGPVSPKRAVILLAFFLVGCVLPVGAIFVRDLFHTSIESMDDLAPLKDIDVIGDIQAITTPMETALVVQANDDSPVTELFRTLRNNLLFMLNEPNKKVVMVTSTVPGEGKTFISINLARSLSLMDKKVLLIGGDIRNPKLSHDLGIPKVNIGFSTYLAGMAHGVDEVTEVLYPNFHIMQAGPVPPNPNELLSKQTLNDLFDGLREVYDYIIIDSAPVGVVSDSFMLNRVADVTLYLMRERVTQKDAVNFVNSIKRDNRLTGVTVVLNATTPQGKYGSYKYGYKYSYRYGYSQKYGYGKSKKA